MKFVHYKVRARGFTLLETLVAISIVLVGLSAAFSVAQSGLSSTIAVKDRITAIFLAQEALEAVKNIKDSNLLAQNAPGGSSTNPDFIAGTSCDWLANRNCDYSYSETPGTIFIQCNILCEALRINTDGVFNRSAGTVSRFSRTIRIVPIPDTETRAGQSEARVAVLVRWPCADLACASATHSYTVQENVSNWFGP